MDVVIPYRRSHVGYDKELRYALRGLSNYKKLGKVYVIGERPDWLQNVEYIPMQQTTKKPRNARAALMLACQSSCSDEFVLMADDIYFTEPMDEIKLYHGGSLAEFLDKYYSRYPVSYYTSKIKNTVGELPDNPNHYELHVPFVVSKAPALSLLQDPRLDNMMFRTLYGNLVRNGEGEYSEDVKYYSRDRGAWFKDIKIGFLSSDDSRFKGEIEEYLKKMFPKRSIYEKY